MKIKWTDELNAKLKYLWEEKGLTYLQISNHEGFESCTRNSIAGKVNRLGLLRRNPSNIARNMSIRKTKQEKRANKTKLIGTANKTEKLPASVFTSPFRTCQWIEDEPTRYSKPCGKSNVPGYSWCPSHFNRVYPENKKVMEANNKGYHNKRKFNRNMGTASP